MKFESLSTKIFYWVQAFEVQMTFSTFLIKWLTKNWEKHFDMVVLLRKQISKYKCCQIWSTKSKGENFSASNERKAYHFLTTFLFFRKIYLVIFVHKQAKNKGDIIDSRSSSRQLLSIIIFYLLRLRTEKVVT